MEAKRLWGRIIQDHRIISSETVCIEDDDLERAIRELCRRFDIQRPVQLPKHDRDLKQFGRTTYSRDHFIETVPFQRLEIEILLPGGKTVPSSGKRSPLTDA